MSSEPTIELVDIYKSFGSTRVLEGVSLPLFPGEVHSLMGENGAGKGTLVKIMAGLYQSEKGALRIKAEEMLFRSPSQAQQAGVSVIYQEPTLFRDLSVAENVHMHRTLRQLAKEGMAIIMISSDLPEVIGMADRVLVMHEGKLTAELSVRKRPKR
jgi:rhamnose transport system ATP-binding protein